MIIAITGSTGMIGSELAELSIKEGHKVIAIVHPGSNRIDNIPKSDDVEIIECDISRYSELLGKRKCDIFYHLAWNKTFGSGRDDSKAQLSNIEYTLDAVELAKSWGAKKFVGAGSQAEYGPTTVKLNGDTPTFPESGYGIAKYTSGKLSKLLCDQLDMEFNWVRILSVYGPLDASHTLIMYLINSFVNGIVPELTACEQIWDYIYSKDAAKALLLIGLKGINGKTYPIGSGVCRPLKEYVMDIRDTINPGSDIGFGEKEYYPHQPMFLCADIKELSEDTGFIPKYDFKNGITETISEIKSKKQID